MGCKYCNFEGECELFDEDIDNGYGHDENGYCTCEDDQNPEDSCSGYESDDDLDDEDLSFEDNE